jgi:hypothetical protein
MSVLSAEDAETAVRNAEAFFRQNGPWIKGIRTHLWEALVRQGHAGSDLGEYTKALEKFMKKEKKREKDSAALTGWEARRSWAPTESVDGLLRATDEAAVLTKPSQESGLNLDLSKLRQGRLFVEALVTTIKVYRQKPEGNRD